MNISLTPELENFIQSKVNSQMYQTASEVIREALRLMAREDQDRQAKFEALRRDIQLGIDQHDRGEYIEGKDLTVEHIRQRVIKRLSDRLERYKQHDRAQLAAKSKERPKSRPKGVNIRSRGQHPRLEIPPRTLCPKRA